MLLPAPDPALEGDVAMRHDRAFAYLTGLLLDGGLEPEDVFSTDAVGKALAISRAPVTDAVKRLVRDGFIAVIPQVGCKVRFPAPGEVEDFYRLFARSEGVITGLAAERRTAAERDSFAVLAAGIDAEQEACRALPDPGPRLRALNRRRYEAIHAMARARVAGELVANMWDRSDFYIRVAFGQFAYTRSVHAANRQIAQAIIHGDTETAIRVTEAYLAEAGARTSAELRRKLGGKVD